MNGVVRLYYGVMNLKHFRHETTHWAAENSNLYLVDFPMKMIHSPGWTVPRAKK